MPNYVGTQSKLMQTESVLFQKKGRGDDFLKWYPEFYTGHDEIDQQHKKTFSLANKLYAAIKSKNHPLALATIESYLGHLKWFSAYEERLLTEALSRQEAERHGQIHRLLIDDAELTYGHICDGRKKPERFFFDVIVIKDIVGHQMENNRIFSLFEKS